MRRLTVDKVEPGMVLGKSIYSDNYDILMNRGTPLTIDYITRLKSRGHTTVYVTDAETADIIITNPISDKMRAMSTKDIQKMYRTTKLNLAKIENDTSSAIIKSINLPKFKKSFQQNPFLTHLCENANRFLEDIRNQNVLTGLNATKSFDNYTYEHAVDTTVISVLIAKRLSLGQDKLKQLVTGEFLHDIGNVCIDEKIANKPGKLAPEEYEKVKLHTVYGYEILKDVDKIEGVAAHISFQHHERQDGMGYPRGLRGSNKIDMGSLTGELRFTTSDKLVILAEIAAIADFYDACISDRPYRTGLSPDLVYELVKTGGGWQFNNELVDCFLCVVPKYPVGYGIKVKCGEYKDFIGVVATLNTSNLSAPKILLLSDNQKNKIKPIEVDLYSYRGLIDIECIN
ncbi:MAG TPA: HD domain-containing phosphohydrolase [Candidatus Brocadiaceae bacterium]|nr:HD domain-containing phosphohydrolase [Candidatus Brocadiaceae bacterium]